MAKLGIVFLTFISCITSIRSVNPNGYQINSSYKKKESLSLKDEEYLVDFMLYNRNHPDSYYLLQVENEDSILMSDFDPSKDTKIIIHGWKNGFNTNFSAHLKNAYLELYDANVINVDWSKQSHRNYLISRFQVSKVANVVARMIDLLIRNHGMKSSNVHIIGHSLGAHVAGIAGFKLTTGNISRITGLDPALPLFTVYESGRLRSDSADFVDVIHSCGNLLGFKSPLGQVDFYPNGGTYQQPGCGFDYKGHCSHARSVLFFTESMKHPFRFLAAKCSDWDSFADADCDPILAPMGEFTPSWVRGNYYLTTNRESPFGRGSVIFPSDT